MPVGKPDRREGGGPDRPMGNRIVENLDFPESTDPLYPKSAKME
jgi:hypothetical protein